MKIFVKSLRGESCVTEVEKTTTIYEIKQRIEADIKVPVSQQTLVLFGKALHDDKTIGHYPKIHDGTKLYVAVKKPESLNVVLHRFLKQYYNEEQTKLIITEFMRDFYAKAKSLSLDDLERIALSDLHNSDNNQ